MRTVGISRSELAEVKLRCQSWKDKYKSAASAK